MTFSAPELEVALCKMLDGDTRQVKLEITCKIVEDAAGARQEETSCNENHESRSTVPRPISAEGRICGIKGLAKFLCVCESTAQKLKNQKRVPCYERGKRVFFYEDEVLAAMKRNHE